MPDSIPTLAVDQFAATLATWFGADSNALATVLPNLSAFSPTTLGFIEPHARRRRKPRTPFPISGRTLKKSLAQSRPDLPNAPFAAHEVGPQRSRG
ncbi:MAG: hypothetical protein E6K32_16340 [Gammaproteobacteria bacterium]|nr:MAG: hypothetical protein E6K30_14465 [Gammaproteobacteria bacterium]TLZ37146.1 MAG: hypothetical protein E6K32_16340 [Gammaproteobacteria bacterium]